MSNQLVKKNPAEGYQNVFPKTFIDAIKDKESRVSLQEILQGFNMYFLSYNGSRALTRCKIPSILRKEGLWITYVLYDHTVVTEWYNSDQIDDNSWSMDSNWRVASNNLVGDVSVSTDGYWVINGEKTKAKAQGEQGITPLLRIGANNKLQVSHNAGKGWKDISDYIVPRFRYTRGATNNTAGIIQISMDLGKTWNNLSNEITNNLRISRYIGINESLPTSGIAEGTVYMKGPYYDENDSLNENPIYRMWVYAWKEDTLAWQDNGEFTSISAGVVQDTGNSETEVMSQKAVTEKLTELESEIVNQHVDLETTSGYYINIAGIKTSTAYPFAYTKPIKVSNGDVVKVKCAAPTSVSVISLTDENNTTSDPVVFGKGGDLETYEYRSEQETYIVLSFETRLPFSCVICKERFSSLGWTERTDIPLGSFLDDNTSFFNYKTKEYVAGNGLFYSKRIDVTSYDALEISTEIISASSKMAVVNFFDAEDNLISFHYRFTQRTKLFGIIDIPNNAEYAVVNYYNSLRSNLKIAGLYGSRIDDALRVKDVQSINDKAISEARKNVVLEDYSNRIYLPLISEKSEYYNYAEKAYFAGNGSWFSMSVEVATMDKMHYSIPAYALTSAAISLLNFIDKDDNLLSFVGRFDALSDAKDSVINIPTGATKCIVNFPSGANSQYNISVSFTELMKDNTQRVYTTPMWREKYFNDNSKVLDKFYNYSTESYEAGNGIWKSIEVDTKGCIAIKCYHQLTSSANKATFTFLDAKGNYIGNALNYSEKDTEPHMRMVWLPSNTNKVIITTLTYTPHDKSRFWVGYKKEDTHYDTMRDMVGNAAKGVCRVGKTALFVNNTEEIQELSETQPAISLPYYDANNSQGQYERIGIRNKLHNEALNNVGGYEISFVPENDGYTRSIIGKDENDVFFIAYTHSNRKGVIGHSINNKLEKTTDFVNFDTIWVSDGMISGISIPNISNLNIKQVRQMADGSYLIFSAYNKVSENKAYVGYFRLSSDFSRIEHVMCTDINGGYSEMNGTGTLLNDGDNHLSDCYDWHINISGKKVICSEYGDRNDLGRVFYSEDCGRTFKEIFRLKNHLQDGVDNDVVSKAHVHGVMIDDYDGRLFVIAGEDNSNLFYSDKGNNTTDDSWKCIIIRNQLLLRHVRYTQVVNAMPFENCILFGSDNEGFGGLYRLNKLEDRKYSALEIAFECKPYVMFSTSYCAASMQKPQGSIPALMCFTRENHGLTIEQNEELNLSHYGRVVASIDGYQFAEVWRDNTYGSHEIFNESTGQMEHRNLSYCTREMNAYVCKNGDIYIKYAGRDFAYLGSEGYIKGYGDFSARVFKIPNGAKLIS